MFRSSLFLQSFRFINICHCFIDSCNYSHKQSGKWSYFHLMDLFLLNQCFGCVHCWTRIFLVIFHSHCFIYLDISNFTIWSHNLHWFIICWKNYWEKVVSYFIIFLLIRYYWFIHILITSSTNIIFIIVSFIIISSIIPFKSYYSLLDSFFNHNQEHSGK